jgi:hypothetical protein
MRKSKRYLRGRVPFSHEHGVLSYCHKTLASLCRRAGVAASARVPLEREDATERGGGRCRGGVRLGARKRVSLAPHRSGARSGTGQGAPSGAGADGRRGLDRARMIGCGPGGKTVGAAVAARERMPVDGVDVRVRSVARTHARPAVGDRRGVSVERVAVSVGRERERPRGGGGVVGREPEREPGRESGRYSRWDAVGRRRKSSCLRKLQPVVLRTLRPRHRPRRSGMQGVLPDLVASPPTGSLHDRTLRWVRGGMRRRRSVWKGCRWVGLAGGVWRVGCVLCTALMVARLLFFFFLKKGQLTWPVRTSHTLFFFKPPFTRRWRNGGGVVVRPVGRRNRFHILPGGDATPARQTKCRCSERTSCRAVARRWNAEYLFGDKYLFLFCRTNSARDLIFV